MKKQFLMLTLVLAPSLGQVIHACEVCYAQANDEAEAGFAKSYNRHAALRHGEPSMEAPMSEEEMGADYDTGADEESY